MGLTRDAGREILHLLKGLIKGFWAAFCLIYVVVWGWDRLLRKTIKESVFLVSIIGGILSIIESALDLEGLHI